MHLTSTFTSIAVEKVQIHNLSWRRVVVGLNLPPGKMPQLVIPRLFRQEVVWHQQEDLCAIFDFERAHWAEWPSRKFLQSLQDIFRSNSENADAWRRLLLHFMLSASPGAVHAAISSQALSNAPIMNCTYHCNPMYFEASYWWDASFTKQLDTSSCGIFAMHSQTQNSAFLHFGFWMWVSVVSGYAGWGFSESSAG